MAATDGAGPGGARSLKPYLGLITWVEVTQLLGPAAASFPEIVAGSWIRDREGGFSKQHSEMGCLFHK